LADSSSPKQVVLYLSNAESC